MQGSTLDLSVQRRKKLLNIMAVGVVLLLLSLFAITYSFDLAYGISSVSVAVFLFVSGVVAFGYAIFQHRALQHPAFSERELVFREKILLDFDADFFPLAEAGQVDPLYVSYVSEGNSVHGVLTTRRLVLDPKNYLQDRTILTLTDIENLVLTPKNVPLYGTIQVLSIRLKLPEAASRASEKDIALLSSALSASLVFRDEKTARTVLEAIEAARKSKTNN